MSQVNSAPMAASAPEPMSARSAAPVLTPDPHQSILAVLQDQHRRLRACTSVLRDPSAGAAEMRVALTQLLGLVSAHAAAEEETFYEALCAHESSCPPVFEASEEHAIAGILAAELAQLAQSEADGAWTPETASKVRALAAVIERQIQDEEKELFTLASRLFSRDELEKLGTDYRTFFFSRGL